MLRLKEITKNYNVSGREIKVLKGLDICFRKNEFVSILGPSGCGKTTTLNIVGGLDKYTSGDLVIAGKSTKNFSDRDWDTYRNHRIGFVFQSYNLIPHQTVLSNVELALTIAGISKEERVKRSIAALDRVGLKGEYNKRPNQLSGGQCQRVAIARALVNEPDILLADEPTGALDSKTSVQIMELIKEISKEKLVIMVTHNSEIAEAYSTRIVRLVDGEIIEDTNPYTEQDEQAELEKDILVDAPTQIPSSNKKVKKIKPHKAKMSWWTAFKLSLKNLFTKRGRTILTSFAGSIGIIGISLILAVSQGTTAYINHVQQTTLSSYPLTLEKTTVDLTSLMQSFMNVGSSEVEHDKDAVYKEPIITELVNALSKVEASENDLKSFKQHLESEVAKSGSDLNNSVSGIQYSYDLDFTVYTKNADGKIIKSDTNELMTDMIADFMAGSFGSGSGSAGSSSSSSTSSSMLNMMGGNSGLWEEMLPGKDGSLISSLVKEQYDVIYGAWPNDYNEVVLVVNKNNEIDDLSLYALGLMSETEIDKIIDAAINKEELPSDGKSWSYEEICAGEYKTVLPADKYVRVGNSDIFRDASENQTFLTLLYENALGLKISGIIRPNDKAESPMLSGAIGYTSKLTEYIIDNSKDAEVILAQQANPSIDVLTGLPFKSTTDSLEPAQKKAAFLEYVSSLNLSAKAEKYIEVESVMSAEEMKASIDEKLMPYGISPIYTALPTFKRTDVIEEIKKGLLAQADGLITEEDLDEYLIEMTDEQLIILLSGFKAIEVKAEKVATVKAQNLGKTEGELATLLDTKLSTATDEQFVQYYDEVMAFSDSTYEDNLVKFGYLDKESPDKINIYATSFESKDVIVAAIKEYNESVEEVKQIKYTDYMGILMSSVTQIVDAITYVLIAFVSISLIVSSIMIGVITLISVQERTKEIGVLRAIGASKRDVSNMFNAETVIIGFTSGFIGVMVTYLLCIPINILLRVLTGLTTLSAFLPPLAALILILISMGLTLLSGLIPSRSAAKKDPVVALRTE